jgi:hypothetical protein
MTNNPEYILLGNFNLKDAKPICDLLEKNKIVFELEIDDQPIRNMTPFQAAYVGTSGTGVTANIYVQSDSLEQCDSILKEI